LGVADVYVDVGSIVAAQISPLNRQRQSRYYQPNSIWILGYLAAVSFLDVGCYARGADHRVSGSDHIAGEIIHPLEDLRICDIFRLNDVFDGVRSAKDALHVIQIDQRRKVLRDEILLIGINLDHGIGEISYESKGQCHDQNRPPSLHHNSGGLLQVAADGRGICPNVFSTLAPGPSLLRGIENGHVDEESG